MREVNQLFAPFERKMRDDAQADLAIESFRRNFFSFVGGATGLIPENTIQPVETLPRIEDIDIGRSPDRSLLEQTAILKLNGGLGTTMGLAGPKSLLPVKDSLTFLDIIRNQILLLHHHVPSIPFLLLNSRSTSKATLDALRQNGRLGSPDWIELMQSSVPKIDLITQTPAAWPPDPGLEWCPPGHGDLYPVLLYSGRLKQLLNSGVKYLFVSNADNLGASLDPEILNYFARSSFSFLMEVCARTDDNKGGHIAWRGDRFVLRESSQCSEAEKPWFEDITRHRFFNTNNLWVRLDDLASLLEKHGGIVPLPLIKNVKRLDPRSSQSPKVVQLETAMGAAIEQFDNAGAIIVPRSRFAPVKTCGDLLRIRSDAYQMTQDWRIELHPYRQSHPPTVNLDARNYGRVDQLDAALLSGVPSLLHCDVLTVEGPVLFCSENKFRGKVTLTNAGSVPRLLPPGEYTNATYEVT